MSEHTCPTAGGLSSDGGFNPDLDWSYVKSDPTDNWHVIGWLVCLVLLAIIWIVSLITINKHLKNYYVCEADKQKHKLRVLLFPPVYATLAWFSYLRFDYSTTIMFFATLFEAFAVFNLFTCLQAYLKPYRIEAGNMKEAIDTKIMFIFKYHLKSKWGMHYRIITDILVFQYPIWSLIDSFTSIFTSLKGVYCESAYSFKGAYVYLTIINFISLSTILTALFVYLDVYHNEWKRGHIPAHGMFWCVKGPIMAIFYLGEILLTALTTGGVIKGSPGKDGSVAWPAEAVENGLKVIIICVIMTIVSFMMLRYFGPRDNIANAHNTGELKKLSRWHAFVEAYIAYIPEFTYMALCCGVDSLKLAKKRRDLKKRKKMGLTNTSSFIRDANSLANNNDLDGAALNKTATETQRLNDTTYEMEGLRTGQEASFANMTRYNNYSNSNYIPFTTTNINRTTPNLVNTPDNLYQYQPNDAYRQPYSTVQDTAMHQQQSSPYQSTMCYDGSGYQLNGYG
ncbi:organic solute transporter Ostalpha-domain-containing protein [Mycotypha africana]|uniref:organic solute transporter Ostalpha-domain-containing protein n=1 Tax=Mycotypha africana TaxID=64632 RepID=UPI002301E7DC|nr:organic solute transporter Ostalpha-domain-containing protein [Mycotypha africana]KAI8972047.1 organic solute transporter Ostalpha-domain-containing protein [Mycotypha africana]